MGNTSPEFAVPPIVRRFLKTSIVFLLLGMLTGLHIGAAEWLGAGTLRHGYVVAHTHVILIGFLMMLVMGVAWWMFPTAPGVERGAPSPFITGIYWAITLAVSARFLAEIADEYTAAKWPGIVAFTASSVETLAIAAFFIALLPRIRSARG